MRSTFGSLLVPVKNVVLEQSIADLDSGPVADQSQQQAHALILVTGPTTHCSRICASLRARWPADARLNGIDRCRDGCGRDRAAAKG